MNGLDSAVNQDFLDLLEELLRSGARFVVVGAHAMAVHGVPRATGDLDVWVDSDPENARRAWDALMAFGAPLIDLGVSRKDLESADRVIQIGLPPRRIDIVTRISGLEFDAAWPRRVIHKIGLLEVPFLGRADLILNKRAAGRPKDLVDAQVLEGGESRKS